MQGVQQLQLKTAPCKLRLLSFLARELIAVRLRSSAATPPTAAASSLPLLPSTAAPPLQLASLVPNLSLAAQALSSRLHSPAIASFEPGASDAHGTAGAAAINQLLLTCVRMLKQAKESGGRSVALQHQVTLEQQQRQQLDEISREMRGEYVHRRALFACRIKATEEAFACSGAADSSEDLLPNVRRQGVLVQALVSRDSVPLFTWRTLQVMCDV
jgi:hypothetical protein